MEIRIEAGFHSEADVDTQIERVKKAMSELAPDVHVVIVADWRRVPIMPPAAAARARLLLTTTSERIERSGILASQSSAAALLQFFRLVKESRHPNRKVLTTPEELEQWLKPLLTEAERNRLREFLSES